MARRAADVLVDAETLDAVVCYRTGAADEMRAVLDALDAVDAMPKDRQVFLARAGGATYGELAEELGVTVERVRQRYCKTERRVRGQLVRWGVVESRFRRAWR